MSNTHPFGLIIPLHDDLMLMVSCDCPANPGYDVYGSDALAIPCVKVIACWHGLAGVDIDSGWVRCGGPRGHQAM